jgi:hypothetical protein
MGGRELKLVIQTWDKQQQRRMHKVTQNRPVSSSIATCRNVTESMIDNDNATVQPDRPSKPPTSSAWKPFLFPMCLPNYEAVRC